MLTIREVIKICFNALLQRLKKHRGNWEQNDPTADDYIKNRPFYTDETNHTIILPEQTLSSLEVTLKEPLIIGETYVVTFNGMDYKCVCRDYDGYRMLGNNAIYEYDGDITTDTGEPFALEAAGDSKNIFFYLKNESEASTVKIGKAKVVKLDKKYLPDLGLAPVATSGNYNDLEDTPTIYTDVVRYNTSQSLSTARKGTAKMNIGAVGYDSAQSLTTTNKTQARTNIGAVGYEAQTLTDAQKTQARTNIGAVAVNDLATVATSGSYNDLIGKPTLFSGNYNDLINKPYIGITSRKELSCIAGSDLHSGETASVSEDRRIIEYKYLTFSKYATGDAVAVSSNGIVASAATEMNSSNGAIYGYYVYLHDQNGSKNQVGKFDGAIRSLVFSPDGSLLIVNGSFAGHLKLYSVSGLTATYVSDISADASGTAFSSFDYSITFSPDGTMLAIVPTSGSNAIKIYSVSGTTVTYKCDVGSSKNYRWILFNSIGNLLFSNRGIYSVSNGSVNSTPVGHMPGGEYDFEAQFSPDYKYIITGSNSVAKLYYVEGFNVTHVKTIDFGGQIHKFAFSPNGNQLAVGGMFSGYLKLYSVCGDNIEYISNINADNEKPFKHDCIDICFSEDGNTLFVASHDSNNGCKAIVYANVFVAFPIDEIPSDAQTDIYVCANDAKQGEEVNTYWITNAHNIEFPVTSVNGKTGAVELTASDVGVEIDNTLSVEGAVADAKAVGDALVAPKDMIAFIDQVNGFIYYVSMRNGTLVSTCAIKTIEVTSMPTTVEYTAGDVFNADGLTIMATRYDGTTFIVTDFTYDAPEKLTEDITSIPVTYTDMGVTYTVNVPITVNPFDPEVILVDFDYTDNGDGTYTITGWKGTYNGEASTEMIVPNYSCIIV